MVFFYLQSPQIAIKRIAHRVKHGGHYVPDEVVVRRYYRGLKNLTEIFMPIVDEWILYQFDKNEYHIIASGHKGDVYDLSANSIMKESDVTYYNHWTQRVLECCNQAVLDMITEEALHDGLVVMSDLQGNPIWVRAREVLEKNPGLKIKQVEYTPVEVDALDIINSTIKDG